MAGYYIPHPPSPQTVIDIRLSSSILSNQIVGAVPARGQFGREMQWQRERPRCRRNVGCGLSALEESCKTSLEGEETKRKAKEDDNTRKPQIAVAVSRNRTTRRDRFRLSVCVNFNQGKGECHYWPPFRRRAKSSGARANEKVTRDEKI